MAEAENPSLATPYWSPKCDKSTPSRIPDSPFVWLTWKDLQVCGGAWSSHRKQKQTAADRRSSGICQGQRCVCSYDLRVSHALGTARRMASPNSGQCHKVHPDAVVEIGIRSKKKEYPCSCT